MRTGTQWFGSQTRTQPMRQPLQSAPIADVDAIMAQLEYELQYRRLEIEAAHKAEQYSDVLHAKAIALEEAGQNAFAAFNL